MPLFTIIIPTYNSAVYLKNALRSIVQQDFDLKEVETLIIDDGSIDNTNQVIEQFKIKNPDLSLTYFYKENGNWGSVINFVKHQKLARGEYIMILDVDDELNKHVLKNIHRIKSECNDLIICDFFKKGQRKKIRVFTYSVFLKRPKTKNQAQTPFCIPLGKFVKNELFYKLSDLKEKQFYQDAYYTSNLILLADKIRHLAKPAGIYHYQRIGNSMSLPWPGSRYLTEVQMCLDFLRIDAQELVAFHLLRVRFRRLIKKNLYRFPIKRKFKFQVIPWYLRLIMHLLYYFFLKKCFRKT